MLRLVHPKRDGQGTRPSSRHHRGGALTHDESSRVKAALKNLRRAYGGFDVIASMTGFTETALRLAAYARKKRTTAALALAAARIAGIPVEQLLTGKPIVAGSCPLCHRKGER